MQILILGANGYLGSRIAHRLTENNVFLVCTKRPKSDLSKLQDIKDCGKVKWIPATVEAIDAALQYTSFDWVLNMACNYGRNDVLYEGVLESNIEFPLKVLNKAAEYGTKKFLTIGTGLPGDFNMYSFSKKVFSEFGKFYAEKHGLDFYNLKLEMFYGSDEPRDRFIPSLIYNMLSGNEIHVTLGTQHRDILAVQDVEKAILATIGSNLKGYREIPVGTGIAPSISEIVDYIWEVTGKKSIIHKGSIPMRPNEPDSIADTSILEEISAWSPVFWKDGIKRMIREIMDVAMP